MSLEDERNIAARYRTVRKHLDSLGYKQALTLDSLPLIEKLLADLIQTTESLKHFKSIAQENIEAHVQLQSTIDPYKCDNARLVQECNQLHLDLIKEKECHQKQVKDLKKEVYKLERECNDLQLASSRNLHRIKELEVESAKKSKRILELQGKCLKPTVSNVGLASKKRPVFPLRRPIIESEPLPKIGNKPLPSLSVVEPKIVDLLSMADHKMNCLSHEVTKLKGELSLQTDNVQTLKSQLTTKEKEILRLKKMLEGGRPYLAVSKDCACKKADCSFVTSSFDSNELKVLQQEKLELEQQLKEALNKQHDAMSQALKLADRNEELEKELRDIDHIALAVEADCNSAVKENNRRVSKLQEKLENVMARVHVLEGELTIERREVQELRADLETCKLEKRNIERTLESTLDEKKQMTDRINELTVIEKNLNDEIERLIKENEKQRQDIIQLQYNNKLLKEEMNRKEMLDDYGTKGAKEKRRQNSYDKEENRIEFQEPYKEKDFLQGLNNAECEKEIEINDLQQAIEQLRRERNFYKNEYTNIMDNYNKVIEKDHVDLWSRIRELKCQLNEKENALDELQREKKELYREKTNLETRLQTYKTEHKIPCNRPCNLCKRGVACNCSPPVTKDLGKMKNIIERLEHERDIARADVDRLIEERDALRERLKIAAEAHTSEQRRLRENLTDVETRLKQIEKERQELLHTQGARRATINGLEDQLQDLQEELRRTKQELGTQRTQYFQLRALQDQTDQALTDAQNQLTHSESELNKALDHNRTVERQQLQLENQIEELQQEITNLKANMTHLDHEKDQLLMVLDEKTERIATLEKEIIMKEQQLIGREQQIRDLQHKNEICVDQSTDQSRQLRSIQLELENLQRQLQTASYDKENAIQENRRMQDDLAATTCEVRNLQRELETSRAESFDLKRQLQTYVSEVRRAEELLARKETERTEMLNHFRSLSFEATVLENNNHSLESEAAEARGALQTAKDQLLDLERQLADKDSLIRGYETQISELTQTVASMESQLRQQGEQKHIAEADLTAVRDLCMKLDQQKDALMQQLNDKDALKTQYDMQITKLKTEQAVIQDQMTKDRATVERLQMLLDQARQESMTVQANNQELQNEMARLRQKMSELQNKLSSESTKLRQYQTQAAEYSKQISELRRQVTNERFDRARKEEEHRRYSDSLPDSIAQTSLPNQTPSQIPNETNDAKHRSLNSTPDSFNNETRRKCDGQTERRGVKILNPIVVECSNHSKDAQRDVPCINIILRSDCKMHSSQYNCIQKENTSLLQANTDSMRTDLKASNMLQFCSFDRKYDHSTVSGLQNCFDVSQSIGMHRERKYNQDNNDPIFNNISQLGYSNDPSFLHHSIQSYKIPITSNNEFQSNSVKTNLFRKINGTVLEETSLLNKAAVTYLNTDDNIKANFNVNKIAQCPANFCKTLPKNFPATRLDNSTKQINDNNVEVSKMIKTDLSLNLEKISKMEEYSTKYLNYPVDLKSTLKNPTNLQLKSPDMLSNIEFMKSESLFKPVTYRPRKEFLYASSLTAPDVVRNVMKHSKFKNTICINKTIDEIAEVTKYERKKFNKSMLVTKKLKNSSIPESMNICSNANCDEINRSTLNPKRDEYDKSSSIKKHSECEDKCISTIDSSLDISQNVLKDVKRFKDKATKDSNDQNHQFKETKDKNMNCIDMNGGNEVILSKINHNFINSVETIGSKCRKMLQEIKKHAETLEEQLIFINKSIKVKKKRSEKSNMKQHRDMITQNPEKKNIYIQKSYLQDNVKYCQNSLINLENNFNSQHVKRQDIILSQIDKESTCEKDHDKNDRSCGRDNANNISPKCIKSAQVQCARSVSFHIFDSLDFKPVATSTPKKINPTENDETLNYTPVCTQTTCTFEENLRTTQIEKITSTEFRNYPLEQENKTTNSANINKKKIFSRCNEKDITQTTELRSYPIEHESKTINSINTNKGQVSSCCNEEAITMSSLTKTVSSNKCLKLKYKKAEFSNFKSTSLIGPCIQCGQRSIKCRSFRRKKQMPIVFKLTSEAYKNEDLRSNGNSCDYENCSAYNCSVSNLVSTVCTQSSNLQITTATSVSRASVSNTNDARNFNKEGISRNEGCVLS